MIEEDQVDRSGGFIFLYLMKIIQDRVNIKKF